ncbi:unnamed protein product [Urochloa humidicola]
MEMEEQMTEEMCAAILAKLEELEMKLDSRNQRLDDTSRKLEEMNARMCRCAELPTSSSASPASSPPQDAALVVSIATAELPMVALARCSTSGPNQDTRVPMAMAASSASPTASPTSSAASPIVAGALPPVAPTRCLASGPNMPVCIPVSETMASAPPSPSLTSTSHQGALLADPITTIKQPAVPSTGCSMQSCNHGILLPAPMIVFEVTPHGPIALSVDDKSDDMHHYCFVGMDKGFINLTEIGNVNRGQGIKIPKFPWLLCVEVSSSWSGKRLLISGFLLEMSPWCRVYALSVQLKIAWPPHIQLKTTSNGADLRPPPWPFLCYSEVERSLPWPSYKFSQQGVFVQFKIPWPPHVQMVVGKVARLQPMLWPSLFSYLTRVQWRQEPQLLELAAFELSTWLGTNVTVLFLFVRPMFCTLWRKCLEETETQVKNQLIHSLLALVSSWMVWCFHMQIDGCNRRKAIEFFQPHILAILLDIEISRWILGWIVASGLSTYPDDQEIDGTNQYPELPELSGFIMRDLQGYHYANLLTHYTESWQCHMTSYSLPVLITPMRPIHLTYWQPPLQLKIPSKDGLSMEKLLKRWLLEGHAYLVKLTAACGELMELVLRNTRGIWSLASQQHNDNLWLNIFAISKLWLPLEISWQIPMVVVGASEKLIKLMLAELEKLQEHLIVTSQKIESFVCWTFLIYITASAMLFCYNTELLKFVQTVYLNSGAESSTDIQSLITWHSDGSKTFGMGDCALYISCSGAQQLRHVMPSCLSSELQLKADKLLVNSDQALLSDLMDNTVAFQAAIEQVFQSMATQAFLSDVMNNIIPLQVLQITSNILAMPWDPGETLQQRLEDKPCFKGGRMS